MVGQEVVAAAAVQAGRQAADPSACSSAAARHPSLSRVGSSSVEEEGVVPVAAVAQRGWGDKVQMVVSRAVSTAAEPVGREAMAVTEAGR